ncbi:hypothetical protein JX265_002903 [Neoarthrinium moseri]|uniref:Thiol methyltransferase 1 n=1 Tax=Neoarthrinium moseri TaxID=1658444 RepID=A0A9Q0ASR7_9PEZI|nr:hypothetical protein JX265_002903 [Neoarthrinium moseri]
MAAGEQPARTLTEHFGDQPFSNHPERWNSLWQDEWTPWDRSGPSMALSDLLEQHTELFDLPGATTRKTALVPGCGRGHDVLLLAAFGFDAYGMDVSTLAIERARKNADAVEGDPVYTQRGARAGTVHWITGDFFKGDWGREIGINAGRFDLIFDYTFYCALPPPAKPAWAQRMVELLAPGGKLVCLEFPAKKPSSEPGPPWAAPPYSYVAYLGRPGQEPVRDEHGGVVESEVQEPRQTDGGLKRVLHTTPQRTHAAGTSDGEIVDRISVWEHI